MLRKCKRGTFSQYLNMSNVGIFDNNVLWWVFNIRCVLSICAYYASYTLCILPFILFIPIRFLSCYPNPVYAVFQSHLFLNHFLQIQHTSNALICFFFKYFWRLSRLVPITVINLPTQF